MGNIMRLVPKSGCFMINTIGNMVRVMGIMRLRNVETFSLNIMYLERAKTSAIFINSEGCKETGPSGIHLLHHILSSQTIEQILNR